MPTALIALGGNLGHVRETFQRAVELIRELDQVRDVMLSPVYRTEPVGAQAGEGFLNAALRCETELAAEVMLQRLLEIENQLGRVRTVHWGPRVIDLDLIALDEQVVESPRLTLPHPALWLRRFVLDPLCEIAPEWRHPVLNRSAVQLRKRLLRRPLPVLFSGYTSEFMTQVQIVLGARISACSQPKNLTQETYVVIGDQELSPFRIHPCGLETEGHLQHVIAVLNGALDNPVPDHETSVKL